MRLKEHGRIAVLVALLGGTLYLSAQFTPGPLGPLPSTAPTTTTQPPTPSMTRPQAATAPRPGNATVLWEKGLLRVDARNSSLNAILRDISLRTGMKIVGGVQEDRVFGTYGPASAATVLQQLLDGSKTNMLLQSDSAMLPIVLTLTPQIGHASPPNPMATAAANDDRLDEDTRVFSPNGPPPSTDLKSQDAGTQAPPPEQLPADRNAPTTNDPNANGARTPQQIMEQLQKLRSQQQTQ